MDLDRAQADWTLGRFPSEDLPELAAQMLVQGHDGPAILELASFHRPGPWDVPRDLVDRAFQDAGRPPLPRDEAMARRVEELLRSTPDPATVLHELGLLLEGACWHEPLTDLQDLSEEWSTNPERRTDVESRLPDVRHDFLEARRTGVFRRRREPEGVVDAGMPRRTTWVYWILAAGAVGLADAYLRGC
jgi:hypothetical protein